MNQNKITLSLFLSGAMAAAPTPGPKPALATGGTNDLYLWTTPTAITDQAGAMAMVQDGAAGSEKTTGLYGCIKSGHMGLVPQKIAWDTNALKIADIVAASGDRIFYGQTDAQNGVAPELVPEAGLPAGTFPTNAPTKLPWGKVADGTAYTAVNSVESGEIVAAYTSNTIECCLTMDSGSAINMLTTNTCLTLVNMVTDGTDAAAVTAVGSLLIDRRVGIYKSDANPMTVAAANVNAWGLDLTTAAASISAGYNADFVLGAVGQRSDNDTTSGNTNWCTKFVYDLGAGTPASGDLEATTGFNRNTKCTWQIQTVDKTTAPQFKLKSATTSAFSMQWIETAEIASIADNSLLATDTAGDAIIGEYESTSLYFNPVIAGYVQPDGTNLSYVVATTPKKAITSTLTSGDFPGSPGNARLFVAVGDAHSEKLSTNSGVFNSYIGVLKSVYDNYETAVNDFNTNVTTYNADLKKYKDAELKTPGQTDVKQPEAICPPTAPTVDAGLNFVSNELKLTSSDQETDITTTYKGKDVVYYTPLNSNVDTTAIHDSRRYGQTYTLPDTTGATASTYTAAYSETAGYAGHVFGRLGQGQYAMPGTTTPWRLDKATAAKNIMNVSIFPESEFGATAFTSSDKIVVTPSVAAPGDFFTVPSVPSVTASTPDAASAVAMGMSIAALSAAVATLY